MQGSTDAFAFPLAITLPERLAVATPVDPAKLSVQPCPKRQSERYAGANAVSIAGRDTLQDSIELV